MGVTQAIPECEACRKKIFAGTMKKNAWGRHDGDQIVCYTVCGDCNRRILMYGSIGFLVFGTGGLRFFFCHSSHISIVAPSSSSVST